MGDTKITNKAEPTAVTLKAFAEGLPGVMKSIASQILPFETTSLEASEALDPRRAAIQTDIFDTEGRRLNQIGAEIQNENARTRAAGEADILGSVGKDLARAYTQAQEIIDPEFFSTKKNAGEAINAALLGAQTLTGGERAEIERQLNRDNAASGTLAAPTALSTVSNATRFGNAAQNKLLSAIQGTVPLLPNLRSGESAFTQTTGRSASQGNPGAPQFIGTQDLSGQASQIGQNFLGQAFGRGNLNTRGTQDQSFIGDFAQGIQAVNSI